MQTADLKELLERDPFRPFSLRLNNGAQYSFKTPRDLGATKDYHMIFFFADTGGAARIDSDSVVEIIEAA